MRSMCAPISMKSKRSMRTEEYVCTYKVKAEVEEKADQKARRLSDIEQSHHNLVKKEEEEKIESSSFLS